MATEAAPPARVAVGPVTEPIKQKRGRPRKYGPDRNLLRPLNPMLILASVPTGVEYTSEAAVGAAMKRGRGRPAGSVSKTPHYRLAMESLGIRHPFLAFLALPGLFLSPSMKSGDCFAPSDFLFVSFVIRNRASQFLNTTSNAYRC